MRPRVRPATWWLAVLAGLALAGAPASAEVGWPSLLTYSAGISSDETARVQISANVSGPIAEGFGAKLGGWWIAGGEDNRAFVGDAYIDYTKEPVYAAAGRKYVPFGPVGLLVSPGIYGAEGSFSSERVTVQAIVGELAFTPVTGGTRFTFAGNRSPAEEELWAARVAVKVTDPMSSTPVTVGLNLLDVLDDAGRSGDISVDVNPWLTLFAESAKYGDGDASAYGLRASNQQLVPDPTRFTMLVLYHRDVPVGFVPAAVGATQYFEDQIGWAGGVYHQFDARRGVGVYVDEEEAIITLFGNRPL